MAKVLVNFSKEIGTFKVMNAVNNGPIAKTDLQQWSNFDDYKKAEIPFARTHDSSFCSRYGGEHCIDVPFIFPDFEADEDDPASYDFVLTDSYIKTIIDAGTEPFFRLGSKIEHWVKKYNTLPPKDFLKWARICEHIIAHYTEGWANGFTYRITYWEIWNEADGALDDASPENKLCWGGTKAQFFDFYKIVALHLKERFPALKIGGPSLCRVAQGGSWGIFGWKKAISKWVADFLQYMKNNSVPLDFLSWHSYRHDPKGFAENAELIRKALDYYGFEDTESILNEWNYNLSFRGKDFAESVKKITNHVGSAFSAATMTVCQNTSVDMLMYYDARPCLFNGLFDFYTQEPLHGYYPFFYFSYLRKLGKQVECSVNDNDIYVLAGKNEDKQAIQVCYFNDDTHAKNKKIILRCEGMTIQPECYLTDENNVCKKVFIPFENGIATWEMSPCSILLIR